MYEILKEFIQPELFILIPVLYLVGIGLKKSQINDKYIPLVLGIISIASCTLYIIATMENHTYKNIMLSLFSSITQGILIAGESVYVNQIYKQATKE